MNTFVKKLTQNEKDKRNNPPVTVAFLGDSVTQGCFEIFKTGDAGIDTVYETEQSYPNRFVGLLRMVCPSAQINLINAGLSGDSAAGALKRLQRDILDKNPDLAVVCLGLNDATQGIEYLAEYAGNMESIFKAICEKNIPCIFMTPNMMNTYSFYTEDKFFKQFYDNIKEKQNNGVLAQFINEAKLRAQQQGVVVCDCYAKWKKLYNLGIDTTALLCNHVNHPARDMHALFAWSLFETVFGLSTQLA